MISMKTAGIREARQNLSVLLEQVAKGREVLITDRGRPVARLVPPCSESNQAFKSHRRLRAGVKLNGRPLSESVALDREDRL
jgi:prevent-host-death family protein